MSGEVWRSLAKAGKPNAKCTKNSRSLHSQSSGESPQHSPGVCLVAPCCAIPRDYLSDTPYCALWGFWCLNMARWVRYPLPLSERFPIGEHAKWRCDTPPQKGYLSDTGAIPYENKAKGCDTPLCDTISKGYCAIGGVSRTGPLRVCGWPVECARIWKTFWLGFAQLTPLERHQ